ncbi:hypothetical protein BGZ61DRAFT_542150 [Ilyonectria robusta]|uniref:uncharacterized protein n=1 Tax=Ilyonectria robusta TaxID=1079257 RepID=UPI001E8D34CC|nr:uncharacterized protein BGZ61DRAFT_542150 [Ilyonectria robusta]KAH8650685.1 hypothetical protein BGZ61DRAFT_542150 [Ilyonectria robusta]
MLISGGVSVDDIVGTCSRPANRVEIFRLQRDTLLFIFDWSNDILYALNSFSALAEALASWAGDVEEDCVIRVEGELELNQSKSPARRPLSGIPQHWRFLFDPDLRGQFACVVFVFEDLHQSTTRCILDEIAKKASGSKGKSRAGSSSSSASSRGHGAVPTDRYIFEHVFNTAEVDRVLSQPDLRYGLRMITA